MTMNDIDKWLEKTKTIKDAEYDAAIREVIPAEELGIEEDPEEDL